MNKEQAITATSATAGKSWSINANVSLQSVFEHPECPPLLRQALTKTLSWQVRNEIPVRRALTSPRAAPQWVAALLAMGATVTVEGSEGPEIPLETLEQGKTIGKISALHVPYSFSLPAGGRGGAETRWGEAHVARTPADEPIVAAVAGVEMDGHTVRRARVALTGVWSKPVRLAQAPTQLVGGPLDEARIQTVAEAVEKEVAPQGDFLGSEEYRRAMAGVLTRRALEGCLNQNGGSDE